jgi:Ca2+-binding RTX toxin-like protein
VTRRVGRLATLTALLALGVPGAASAANVEIGDSGRSLFVFASPGEANDVTVSRSGNTFTVTDTGAALTPGPGCAPVNANTATCSAVDVGGIKISLGNMNDAGRIDASVTPMPLDSFYSQDVEMDGDDGADVLTGGPNVQNTLNGGFDFSFVADPSPDVLTGGAESDSLRGGEGNDAMNAGDGGFDSLFGGPGDDAMNGGPGSDSFQDAGERDGADTMIGGLDIDNVEYDRDGGVRVSLNDVADDGEGCPGAGCESDNVRSDVENVSTGDGGDTIIGSAAQNQIFSGDGPDTVDGGAGGDNIFASRGEDALLGGVGDDTLSGSEGSDLIRGAADDDVVFSGAFDDEPDNVFGGTGIDLVDYTGASAGVRVSFDNRPNDGVPGEGDNAHRDVEDAFGSRFADTLVGSRFANQLEGGDGRDRIRGLGGADGLVGGRGADLLVAGAGRDALDAGPARDRLLARGGGADDLSCGSSIDRGKADRRDRLAGDCDRVRRGRRRGGAAG